LECDALTLNTKADAYYEASVFIFQTIFNIMIQNN